MTQTPEAPQPTIDQLQTRLLQAQTACFGAQEVTVYGATTLKDEWDLLSQAKAGTLPESNSKALERSIAFHDIRFPMPSDLVLPNTDFPTPDPTQLAELFQAEIAILDFGIKQPEATVEELTTSRNGFQRALDYLTGTQPLDASLVQCTRELAHQFLRRSQHEQTEIEAEIASANPQNQMRLHELRLGRDTRILDQTSADKAFAYVRDNSAWYGGKAQQ
ncbi:MAG: hypothetical protein WCV93_01495 [Candidatus Shapirobacteria bacterium]|jgi:hypothetical protein